MGPILFNIFINDLFFHVQQTKLNAYADDHQIYRSNVDICNGGEKANQWDSQNGMIMNAKKHQVFSIVTKEFVQCTSFSLSNVLRGTTQRATYQHCYPMSAYKKSSRVIVQRKQKIAFYNKRKKKRNFVLLGDKL